MNTNNRMLTHTWVDQCNGTDLGNYLQKIVPKSVQFDCGEYDDIPVTQSDDWKEARSPYPTTILQFATSKNAKISHVLVLWEEISDKKVEFLASVRKREEKKWVTTYPTRVTIKPNGDLQFECDCKEEYRTSIGNVYGMAKNLFYVLGCTNVITVNNPAPAKLNKKREQSGKYPILEYKTLAIKIDATRSEKRSLGGTHASPRLHLRRGHVRNLGSGKRVWVQACVVGSKHGVILKDYRITQKNPSKVHEVHTGLSRM